MRGGEQKKHPSTVVERGPSTDIWGSIASKMNKREKLSNKKKRGEEKEGGERAERI